METILYSTHCPICNMLEMKLKEKGVKYQINTNVEEMKSLGFTSVPILKVNNQYLTASEAIKYVNRG